MPPSKTGFRGKMLTHRTDLADLPYFLAIARHRSFRLAAVELGVTTSALSHALKGLEERLGVRLLNRTSRSVALTAAGESFFAAVSGSYLTIADAFEGLNQFRDAPTGRVRLNVMSHAASQLIGPVLPEYSRRYPNIELEVAVNNRLIDVVQEGYDAGVRYGGTVPEDMISQRLSAEMSWVAVAAPAYLDAFGTPQHPNDLLFHRCIRGRAGDDRIFRWDFDRGEESLSLDVPGSIIIDHTDAAMPALLGGAGIGYMPEIMVRPLVKEGRLKLVLEEWASPGAAFHIYYSSRRNVPAGLRLLIDLILELKPAGY